MRERADPDEAVGQSRNCDTPVHVIDYGTTPISAAIGREFLRLANDLAIDSQQAIILAHKRKDARLAAGQFSGIGPIGNSRVSIVARAVGTFWSSASSGRDREYALRYVERSVLQLMGKIEQGEPVRAAILRNEINHRWLRRTVLKIVTDVPCSCEDSDDAREAWLIALHDAIRQCDIEYADGVTVTGFFTRRGNQEWHRALQEVDSSPVRSGTVHEAKGREYEAVCFVIPPNRGPRNHTEQLIASWESRTNTEFVRVAYVAVTRSKNFVVVALPSAFRGRVETILDNGHVPYVNHEIR